MEKDVIVFKLKRLDAGSLNVFGQLNSDCVLFEVSWHDRSGSEFRAPEKILVTRGSVYRYGTGTKLYQIHLYNRGSHWKTLEPVDFIDATPRTETLIGWDQRIMTLYPNTSTWCFTSRVQVQINVTDRYFAQFDIGGDQWHLSPDNNYREFYASGGFSAGRYQEIVPVSREVKASRWYLQTQRLVDISTIPAVAKGLIQCLSDLGMQRIFVPQTRHMAWTSWGKYSLYPQDKPGLELVWSRPQSSTSKAIDSDRMMFVGPEVWLNLCNPGGGLTKNYQPIQLVDDTSTLKSWDASDTLQKERQNKEAGKKLQSALANYLSLKDTSGSDKFALHTGLLLGDQPVFKVVERSPGDVWYIPYQGMRVYKESLTGTEHLVFYNGKPSLVRLSLYTPREIDEISQIELYRALAGIPADF